MKLALLFISLLFNIHADTISNIKQRGVLNCGVSTGLPGFSSLSDKEERQLYENSKSLSKHKKKD